MASLLKCAIPSLLALLLASACSGKIVVDDAGGDAGTTSSSLSSTTTSSSATASTTNTPTTTHPPTTTGSGGCGCELYCDWMQSCGYRGTECAGLCQGADPDFIACVCEISSCGQIEQCS